MLIKQYMREATYNYKLHATFGKDGMLHYVITEFTPSGQESKFYILHEKDNTIFNENGQWCCKLIDGKLEIWEG